jgi:hypothetical protein
LSRLVVDDLNAYHVTWSEQLDTKGMQRLITDRVRYEALNRNFSGLMELYELNYLNLRRLIPDTDVLGEHFVSATRGGLDLHFHLLEKCKYTVTFSLSYCFYGSGNEILAPDMQIRMYNDAQVAEVISGIVNRHFLHRNDGKDIDVCHDAALNTVVNRWRLNRFLGKWLKFCIKQGHSFRLVPTAGEAQDRIYQLLYGEGAGSC